MEEPIIRVRGLGKRYLLGQGGGERYRALRDVMANSVKGLFRRGPRAAPRELWALRDVGFDVREGDKVGLIGRNGAGKSTLLKILSEITEPTHGEARIRGRTASILEIGAGFHPELTGRENIFMNGAIMGMTRAEVKRKFDEIAAFAEVEKFLDTPVKRYSSGMYMRLAFSVAAHLEPEVLLVDEVLAVGDMAFQSKCLGKMKDMERGGRTVIFVSHNMGAIRSLCKTAIWLDKGGIVQQGPAEQVVRDYVASQVRLLEESSAVRERAPSEAAAKGFHVRRVEMRDASGESNNAFNYGDQLSLLVDLGGASREKFSLEFRVYNELGQFVACGASGAFHGIYFGRDTRRIRVHVGPLSLTSGRYTVSLSLVQGLDGAGVFRADTWEDAAAFTILECKPFKTSWEMPAAREGACVLGQSFAAVE